MGGQKLCLSRNPSIIAMGATKTSTNLFMAKCADDTLLWIAIGKIDFPPRTLRCNLTITTYDVARYYIVIVV